MIFLVIHPLKFQRDGGFILLRHTGMEVGLTAQILSTEVIGQSLMTFLTGRRGSRFSMAFHFTPSNSRVYLRYSERTLNPSISRIKREISALLSTYHITLDFDEDYPKTGKYGIKDPLLIPSLERIVTDIVLMQPENLILGIDYSFSSDGCRIRSSFTMDKEHRQIVNALLSSYGTSIGSKRSTVTTIEDAWRLLRFKSLSEMPNYVDLLAPDTGELCIGRKLLNGNPYADLLISVSDFRMGGIISGAIGQGKTNLRIQIIDYLMKNGVRVIDFDLKGDLRRYPHLVKNATIMVPKVNFRINIFACPDNLDKRTYSELLFTSLEQSMEGDITPPQLYLLEKAVLLTVENGGNPHDFFFNILVISERDKAVLDTRQDATALALITRLSWMKGSLRDVFWTSENSFTANLLDRSVIFDLSALNQSTPLRYIRLLMEIILMRVITTKTKIDTPKHQLETLISIDEGQLLMPNHRFSALTKLEEIVTTMRYQGIAVLVAGVHQDMMSPVLLDTGFSAHFRTFNEESDLRQYQCKVRKESSGYQTVIASIKQYSKPQKYTEIRKLHTPLLQDFSVSRDVIDRARELSNFPELIELNIETREKVDELLDSLNPVDFIKEFRETDDITLLIKILGTLAKLLSNYSKLRGSYLDMSVLRYLIRKDTKSHKRSRIHLELNRSIRSFLN